MNTNILFKIDKKTKDLAAKKAKNQGLTLSAFLRSVTKAYIDGDLDVEIEVSQKTGKSIEAGVREVQAGDTANHEDVFARLGV